MGREPNTTTGHKKNEATSVSKRSKGKKQVKGTLARKDNDDKGMCFQFGVKRNWERNYKKYLIEKAQ